VKIGSLTATVESAGLVSAGLYEFDVVVPAGAPSGDNTLTATYNGMDTAPLALITIEGSAAPSSATFYVAPNGNDSWTGTLASPNPASTDGPFATFDHARTVVRALNKTGLSQVSVQLRGGNYFLPDTVHFAADDSGTLNTQIVYQNFPGESPIISGGMRIGNWTRVGGNMWTAPLPASTKYFENLYYNGVRRLRPRLGGDLGTYFRVAATVYLNAPGPPAAAPDPSCSIYVANQGWECFDRFQFDPADPIVDTWKNLAPPAGNACGQPMGNPALAGDIELLDFEQFATSILRVSCVDTRAHVVYLTGPTGANPTFYGALGFNPKRRYLVENVRDQLLQAGQWFLDRSTTPWTLTYLSNEGEDPNTDTVIVPQLTQVLVASNLQYVTFQGLTFQHDNYTVPAAGQHEPSIDSNYTAAVSFQNSQHITFDAGIVAHTSGGGLEFVSCTNEQAPSWCVSLDAGRASSNNVVENSAFYDIGFSGFRVGMPTQPGDTGASVPQFHTFQNNVVEGYGRVFPDSQGIVQGEGHDNTYTHNDVYDGYHSAMTLCVCSGWPSNSHDNVFSFNHVYNLFQGITNDGGSIYMQTLNDGTTAPAGNKMLNNKIHDVSDASAMDEDGYGGDGLYIDNLSGSIDVENNLVYRVSDSAVYLAVAPPGPDQANTIRNNILAFPRLSMIGDGYPYASGSVPPSLVQTFVATNNLFYFDRDITSTPAFFVQGGCTYSGGFPYASWQQWNSNLYWRTDGGFAGDATAFHVQPNPGVDNPCYGSSWAFVTWSGWQNMGEDVESLVQNPKFANPTYPADDYSLPAGSPGVGFVVFDPNQAGRSNPVINPFPVPATFPTKSFNPATDY